MATRDIDFEVPTEEAIAELIKLCRAEGWTVDEETDVFKYRKGVPFHYADDLEPYTPDEDRNIVYAHISNFPLDDDELFDKTYAKADELAAKVGGSVTGGGVSFGED